jgi:hypothetical protein
MLNSMKPLRLQSAVEQVTEHLRDAIREGELCGEFPGVKRPARGMEVDARIICAGSQEVLNWFPEQSVPAFALILDGPELLSCSPPRSIIWRGGGSWLRRASR